jgi:hypothetical protein
MRGRIHVALTFAALVAGALLALEAPAQPGGTTPAARPLAVVQPSRRGITALAPRQFQERDYARVPTGGQEDGIGIFAGREDEAPRGPSSFTVDEAGEVTILDNEKRRLVALGSDQRVLKTAPIEGARHFTQLTRVGKGELAAFDSRRDELVSFSAQGKVHERLKDLPRVPFTRIQRLSDGQVAIESPGRTHVLSLPERTGARVGKPAPMQLMRRTAQPGAASLAPVTGTRVAGALRTGKRGLLRVQETGIARAAPRELSVEPPVPGRLGSVTVLREDSAGRLFVRIEVLTSTSPLVVRRFIRAYDKAMNVLDTFEYPVEGLIIGDKDVDVDDQGHVYVLLTYPDRVEVQRFSP